MTMLPMAMVMAMAIAIAILPIAMPVRTLNCAIRLATSQLFEHCPLIHMRMHMYLWISLRPHSSCTSTLHTHHSAADTIALLLRTLKPMPLMMCNENDSRCGLRRVCDGCRLPEGAAATAAAWGGGAFVSILGGTLWCRFIVVSYCYKYAGLCCKA